MEEDLLFALDEPFVPASPISAFPRDEHGDVFPTKKTRHFDYEKQATSIYRPRNFLFKLKRLAYRAIGLAVGEPVVFFRYHLKIENRSVFRRHRKELKEGFVTVANHAFFRKNPSFHRRRLLHRFRRARRNRFDQGSRR